MKIPNHDSHLLSGSDPKESGEFEAKWTITITTRDHVADEHDQERRLGREFTAIWSALASLRIDAKVEVDDDPETTWL